MKETVSINYCLQE